MNTTTTLFTAFCCACLCLSGCGREQGDDTDMSTGGVDMAISADMSSPNSETPDASMEADMTTPEDMGDGLDMTSPDPDMSMASECEGAACRYTASVRYSETRAVDGFTLSSPIGNRELPMLVRFPVDAGEDGPLPVVIWAHGGSWSRNGHKLNEDWSTRIAQAGYVVVHFAVTPPEPEDLPQICMLAGLTDPQRCDDISLTDVDIDKDDPPDNPFSAITVVRPSDARTVYEALPMISQRLSTMAGVEADASRVIIAGWSGGAQVVLQAAGAKRYAEASTPPYHDPLPGPIAFIALSPQGPGFSNFYATDEETSWDLIDRPTMVMTGVGDEKPGNDLTGPDRLAVYTHLPEGGKRLFYSTSESDAIKHSTFNLQEVGSSDADAAAVSRALESAMLAFLDFHTRGHMPAGVWLDSDAAVKLAGEGKLDWLQK